MRKGILVAGIVVLVLGGLLLGASFILDSSSQTIPSPSTHSELTFSPNFIGSGTVSLSWSSAGSQFRFSVYQCASSACSSPGSSSPLANGAGNSGSVSFSATGGQYYVIVVTGGQASGNAVPVTVTLSGGLTPLLLIGIVVLAIGAIVALLGYRAKAKPKVVYEDDIAPKKDTFVTTSKPFSGVQQGPAATATVSTPRERSEAPESSGPVFFQPEGEESYGSNAPTPTPAPAAGARPPIKCSYCGTMNEPWITNCRNCRRPLSSTGG